MLKQGYRFYYYGCTATIWDKLGQKGRFIFASKGDEAPSSLTLTTYVRYNGQMNFTIEVPIGEWVNLQPFEDQLIQMVADAEELTENKLREVTTFLKTCRRDVYPYDKYATYFYNDDKIVANIFWVDDKWGYSFRISQALWDMFVDETLPNGALWSIINESLEVAADNPKIGPLSYLPDPIAEWVKA